MTSKKSDAEPERKFLRRREASAYIESRYGAPCSMQHLAKLAVHGGGPVFRKFGRYPVYEVKDLDAWGTDQMSPPMKSTSDKPKKPEENEGE